MYQSGIYKMEKCRKIVIKKYFCYKDSEIIKEKGHGKIKSHNLGYYKCCDIYMKSFKKEEEKWICLLYRDIVKSKSAFIKHYSQKRENTSPCMDKRSDLGIFDDHSPHNHSAQIIDD